MSLVSDAKMLQCVLENGKRTMPMSVHVHHGLMDGLHVGQFVDFFQDLMNG